MVVQKVKVKACAFVRKGGGPHLPTYLPTAQNTPTTDTPTKHTNATGSTQVNVDHPVATTCFKYWFLNQSLHAFFSAGRSTVEDEEESRDSAPDPSSSSAVSRDSPRPKHQAHRESTSAAPGITSPYTSKSLWSTPGVNLQLPPWCSLRCRPPRVTETT